jgi:hypothetical protein
MSNKIWTADIIEANDGTGDAILQFPEEFIATTGWKEGTELILTVVGEGTSKHLIITEKNNESI